MIRTLRTGLLRWLLGAWLPVVLVVMWWFGTAHSSSFYIPPLHTILVTFRQDWIFDKVSTDVVPSVVNLLGGVAIAIVVGLGVGLVFGLSRMLRVAFNPILQFLRSLPTVGLIPVALLLLGIGHEEKMTLVAFGAVWPVLLNTIDGVAGIDPPLTDMARCYRLTRWQRIVDIVLPAASVKIMAGVRTSLGIAVIMVVVSEMYGATQGIGYYVLFAERSFSIPQAWAGTILLGLLGYLINVLFRFAEHRVLHWHPSHREN